MRQQMLARRGEALDTAPAGAAALHQPRARQSLQFGEGLGNGRLAQCQPLGGARQMALLRDRDEATQMPQLDTADKGFGTGRH